MQQTINAALFGNSFANSASKAWSKVGLMVDGFFELLPNIVIAVVVFILFYIAAKVLQSLIKRWTRDRQSDNVGIVIGRIGKWVLLLLGLMVAVSIVAPSMGPAEFFGALGVGSVAIGFAFKDILQNFLAGILILVREPFRVGDTIECEDYTGLVERIETRSTFLRTFDGQEVIIPNGTVFTNPVVVVTAHPNRRNECTVGIGYADDIRRATKAIEGVLEGMEEVLDDPSPTIETKELGGSSVNLRIRWWTKNEDYASTGSEVVTRVKERLDEEGIDMPYPTQVHLLHDQTEESDGDRRKQREGWPPGDDPPKSRREADIARQDRSRSNALTDDGDQAPQNS